MCYERARVRKACSRACGPIPLQTFVSSGRTHVVLLSSKNSTANFASGAPRPELVHARKDERCAAAVSGQQKRQGQAGTQHMASHRRVQTHQTQLAAAPVPASSCVRTAAVGMAAQQGRRTPGRFTGTELTCCYLSVALAHDPLPQESAIAAIDRLQPIPACAASPATSSTIKTEQQAAEHSCGASPGLPGASRHLQHRDRAAGNGNRTLSATPWLQHHVTSVESMASAAVRAATGRATQHAGYCRRLSGLVSGGRTAGWEWPHQQQQQRNFIAAAPARKPATRSPIVSSLPSTFAALLLGVASTAVLLCLCILAQSVLMNAVC